MGTSGGLFVPLFVPPFVPPLVPPNFCQTVMPQGFSRVGVHKLEKVNKKDTARTNSAHYVRCGCYKLN